MVPRVEGPLESRFHKERCIPARDLDVALQWSVSEREPHARALADEPDARRGVEPLRGRLGRDNRLDRALGGCDHPSMLPGRDRPYLTPGRKRCDSLVDRTHVSRAPDLPDQGLHR